MLLKQNKNDFIAFKAIFNQRLHKAIYSNDIDTINHILKSEYVNDKYKDAKIDINAIQSIFEEHMTEIKNNPESIYKL